MSLEKAKEYLVNHGYNGEVLIFDVSSATVELAALALSVAPERIAKTLSFLTSSGPILIVVAGSKRVDNHKFKAEFKEKARFIPPQDVESLIGHQIGGVCPFGINEGVKVYLDSSLLAFDTVYPASGSSNSAIKIAPEELFTLSGAIKWVDITS